MKKNISISLISFAIFILLSSCGIYKPSDARKVSPNDMERIKANQKRPLALKLTKTELIDLIKKRSIVYSKAMYKINCENQAH